MKLQIWFKTYDEYDNKNLKYVYMIKRYLQNYFF